MAASVVSTPPVEESKDAIATPSTSSSAPASASDSSLPPLPTPQADPAKLALSAEHKNKGNAAFAANRHADAIASFSSALALDPTNPVLYSNRSAAYTALGKKEPQLLHKAVADAKMAVRLQPDFVKGYVRQGTALSMLKQYEEAVQCYANGLSKDPSSRLLLEGLQQAQKFVAEKAASSGSADDVADAGAEAAGGVTDVVIGIDLGTTYSCVGVWQGKGVTMIPNERGSLTSPSWVCFSDTGKRFVGQAAKNMAARFPANTIFDVKRIIGQKYDDEGVSADIDRMPYRVVPSEPAQGSGKGKGKPLIQVDMGMHGKKTFAPEEISAMVLAYLKKTAEVFLKRPVSKAVVTVPAYFNDSQRSATKAAGKIAGLDVLRIINEPTAAALSYGLDRRHQDKPSKVLIFDLGGGTFDVSVLAIEGGVTEVKATGGDTRLGGEDFDINVTRFLVSEGVAQGMPDISSDPRAMRRLQNAVEQAKRQLSQSSEADIKVEALFTLDVKQRGSANYKTLDFDYKLTRAKFEALNLVFFNKTLETVKKVLKDAKLKPADIDDIVLVGGSTRIPKIQEMLQEYFGGKVNVSSQLCTAVLPSSALRVRSRGSSHRVLPVLCTGAVPFPQPRRGRGVRRGRAGRHSQQLARRADGQSAADGRHAALAGHRDHRPRHVRYHPPQHLHPLRQDADLHYRGELSVSTTCASHCDSHSSRTALPLTTPPSLPVSPSTEVSRSSLRRSSLSCESGERHRQRCLVDAAISCLTQLCSVARCVARSVVPQPRSTSACTRASAVAPTRTTSSARCALPRTPHPSSAWLLSLSLPPLCLTLPLSPLVAQFTISGIERAKRGVPKIDVSFALDSNGILQVTAKDQTTMAEAHIEIERSGRSSDADIERMVKEAAKYRAEDEERVKRVEAFNDLESLVTETRTMINDLTDAKKAAQLETLVDDTEAWAQEHEENGKIAEIKLKRRQLEQQISKLLPK